MFSAEKIKELVATALPGSTILVNDFAGDNDHFEIKVISPAFEGKRLVERHRMVYAALGGAMTSAVAIHALSIKALTPTEEEKE